MDLPDPTSPSSYIERQALVFELIPSPNFFLFFLQMFDDIIFAFFSLEMTIKMVAMGIYGKGTYLADSWNRLDFFIVAAG